ncbi:hypothetical protein OO184_11420 [Photorhabdus sp. APURE]|uniref:hypothetical protein n=1 Tax=Photorhabdus aballayi TaxID=2991723 RepID=UPI00223CFE69|nr:hypothetical protein [Photorhabdus aballayi]MCW7548534.1 hypothetical protein [Photorhabdus aballayi]
MTLIISFDDFHFSLLCLVCFVDDALMPLWMNIPVIFQVASLLAALTHPGHIVRCAPGDSLPCRRDAS